MRYWLPLWPLNDSCQRHYGQLAIVVDDGRVRGDDVERLCSNKIYRHCNRHDPVNSECWFAGLVLARHWRVRALR